MKTREIKFRAWDNTLKIMFDVVNVKDGFRKLENKQITISQLFDEAEKNSYIPMQFTGLKDKNGKEIYEGDITNCGVVGYCTGLHWEGGGSVHPGFYFDIENSERDELYYHCRFDDTITEVIGNIYENPELLNNK